MVPQVATAEDLESVRALLRDCGLPEADLAAEHMPDFLLLKAPDGSLRGCIGLQRAAADGLLRSLAVDAAARGQGLGAALLAAVHGHAAACGVERLYLLTTTAPQFFAAHGYTRCNRSDVPSRLQSMSEFAGVCPASAVCMTRPLKSITSP